MSALNNPPLKLCQHLFFYYPLNDKCFSNKWAYSSWLILSTHDLQVSLYVCLYVSHSRGCMSQLSRFLHQTLDLGPYCAWSEAFFGILRKMDLDFKMLQVHLLDINNNQFQGKYTFIWEFIKVY